jgi:hypothetical protein
MPSYKVMTIGKNYSYTFASYAALHKLPVALQIIGSLITDIVLDEQEISAFSGGSLVGCCTQIHQQH